MARLTEQEIELIRRAKYTARSESIDSQQIIAEAERLRAETLAVLMKQATRWLARTTGLSALGRGVSRTIFQPLRRAILRRRTVSSLQRLDDRMLSDIGLRRDDIGYLATQISRGSIPGDAASEPSSYGVLRRLRGRWRTRRALEALSDDVLQDIGVPRGNIPAVVDRLYDRNDGRTPSAETRSGPLRALKHRVRRARARRELEALSDHVLSDIGVRRSEIPDLVKQVHDGEVRRTPAPPVKTAAPVRLKATTLADLGLASLPPSVVDRLMKRAA